MWIYFCNLNVCDFCIVTSKSTIAATKHNTIIIGLFVKYFQLGGRPGSTHN